ncbi:MAG: FAD:protein FMN transferase [Pirellulaceae bacterium]|nr:FAD:protein FMN transferase [Pirellulaceae bacterium]
MLFNLTRRRFCLSLALGAGGAACYGLSRIRGGHKARASFFHASTALGTKVEITALHSSRAQAADGVQAAFAELDLVEEVMSLYRPHSQLRRLNREGVLRQPHPYLVEVLTTAQELAENSSGKFDVTIQPLWKLHESAARDGRTPSAAEIAAAVELVDWRGLKVSTSHIQLARPGMAVTLNGIAQGYAADRAKAALQKHGIEHALINTGELTALGSKSSGHPWRVGIQHPRVDDAYIALADLDGRCLATSGDYATTFGNDRDRHHILDPDTGASAAGFASVSIAAPSGLLADGLSTAVFVLGPKEGERLVKQTAGTDLLGVLENGRLLRTAGFPTSRDEEGGA